MAAMKFGFGKALTRKEDDALLRGAGTYVADVLPEAALHAVVLRSPHAHAKFGISGLERVRAMKGVRLVLTAADIRELGPLPTPGVLPDVDIKVPDYPILAVDTVKHVGDAIAFVVGDTLNAAKDGAEAITVDWQPLPHVIGAVAALKSGAPLVWDDQPGNLAFETSVGDAEATKQAFAQAARRVSLTIVNQRLVTNYMDTRGVIAEYDGDRYTLTLGSQGSHIIRDIIGGAVMKLPPEKMRVITPDVGGGFGTKLFPYREYALAAVAAERLRKPVKWVADSASRSARSPSRSWRWWRRACWTGRSGGWPTAANIFSATATAATTFRPRRLRSTTRANSLRSTSISLPTWVPICRATGRIFRGSGSAWRRVLRAAFRPAACRSAPARTARS